MLSLVCSFLSLLSFCPLLSILCCSNLLQCNLIQRDSTVFNLHRESDQLWISLLGFAEPCLQLAIDLGDDRFRFQRGRGGRDNLGGVGEREEVVPGNAKEGEGSASGESCS